MEPDYVSPDGSVRLYCGDCLEVMPVLDTGIDAVITDPPYGTTACKWDSVIPFAPMWAELKRAVKQRAAIVLFGSQPFTSALVMSNPKWFRYEWIWEKSNGTNFATANKQPMKSHENILVFGCSSVPYYPQKTQDSANRIRKIRRKTVDRAGVYGEIRRIDVDLDDTRYPRSVQRFASCPRNNQFVSCYNLHPTQKPIPLLEYFAKTYTNAGDTVLDFAMGSGSTAVACIREGRGFIGIEREREYFNIAVRRIEAAIAERDAGEPCLFDEAAA